MLEDKSVGPNKIDAFKPGLSARGWEVGGKDISMNELKDCIVLVKDSDFILNVPYCRIVKGGEEKSVVLEVTSRKDSDVIIHCSPLNLLWCILDFKIAKEIKIGALVKLDKESTMYDCPKNFKMDRLLNVSEINQDSKQKVNEEDKFRIKDVFEAGIIVQRDSDKVMFCTSPCLIIEIVDETPKNQLQAVID